MASDQELIERSLDGDRFAFDGIIKRYETALFRRFFKLTGNREQTEDICQEAFLRFYKALPRFKRDRGIEPLLATIAMNIWRDHLRKTFADVQITERDASLEEFKIDEEVLQRLEHQAILDAIDRLRPEYREVLSLRYYQGLRYQEIAKLTGIPGGTVASWLHRALDALREELKEELAEEKV